MEVMTYQEGLDNYSANDERIYKAISQNLRKLGVNPFVFGKEAFDLEGGNEESVEELHMTDGKLGIVTKNAGGMEVHEYSLTGDDISQLDKLQILSVLEDAVEKMG